MISLIINILSAIIIYMFATYNWFYLYDFFKFKRILRENKLIVLYGFDGLLINNISFGHHTKATLTSWLKITKPEIIDKLRNKTNLYFVTDGTNSIPFGELEISHKYYNTIFDSKIDFIGGLDYNRPLTYNDVKKDKGYELICYKYYKNLNDNNLIFYKLHTLLEYSGLFKEINMYYCIKKYITDNFKNIYKLKWFILGFLICLISK